MSYEVDVFARQQAYLEFVKNYEADKFDDAFAEALWLALASILAKQGIEKLSELPKRQFRTVLAQVNAKITAMFGKFRAATLADLKAILNADLMVSEALFSTVSPQKVTLTKASTNRKKLWAKITNGAVPGVGDTPGEMIGKFFSNATRETLQLVKHAYADSWDLTQIRTAFLGTKANGFKDGLFRKLRNQFGAMSDTLIQNISSYVGEVLGAVYYTHYEWISVLDSRTTEICQHRDGKVYEYGNGPRPPAHYRCRSRTRPVALPAKIEPPQTYFTWLKSQPDVIQNDIIGQRRAAGLRKGQFGSADFPRFIADRRLTPEEYVSKRSVMLTKAA